MKVKLSLERNPEKHSLEAVGILKQAMDKEDKYLIYKINSLQFNGEPDYALKSMLLWLSWQLIWTRMAQNIHNKAKKLILMAVIHEVLDINSCIIQIPSSHVAYT